jgi:hypothetical protein
VAVFCAAGLEILAAAGEAEARSQKPRSGEDPARRPGAELLPACCCFAWCLVLALVLAVAVSSAPSA